jgi:hypothetical protein
MNKMRTATTISTINGSPKVMIDNYGTMAMYDFAQKLFKAGKVDYKATQSAKRIAFTSEYATRLLNENLDLFPIQF